MCPTDRASLPITGFHQWFYRGVAQWLDMALYKAMQRIEKAVELDRLVPVDASVKYSSSAVDTLSIFYQVCVLIPKQSKICCVTLDLLSGIFA